MNEFRDSFGKLEKIYDKVPSVPCAACGKCCVSPHVTILEFAYMLEHMLGSFERHHLAKLVAAPVKKSALHKGNNECSFQTMNKLCAIHHARSLSCRIEGLPVLEAMGIRAKPICENIEDRKISVTVHPRDIDIWVEQVFGLSEAYHDVYSEPWFVNALTPECWWAIIFDEKIGDDFFLSMRERFRSEFDIEWLKPYYSNHTKLPCKLANIRDFFNASTNGEAEKAMKLIKQVIHNYPRTGSYYLHEGKQFFLMMKKIVKDRSAA
ncbi:MAG: YkgJ family cysteine cluster protein [Planctomycetes bacterium]|nr:YkgJ family cysteine cluster protein [Planctomycetota bacterium]